MSHTKGPWHFNAEVSKPAQKLVYSIDGYLIANVGGYKIDDGENEANARRIVACVNACEGIADPSVVRELLEALKMARDNLLEWKDDAQCDHSVGICWCGYHRMLEQVDACTRQGRAGVSMSSELSVCGCGECDFCQNLSRELRSRLTPQERAYDNYQTRLSGSSERENEED